MDFEVCHGTANYREAILPYEAPGTCPVLIVSVSIFVEIDSRCVLPDTFNECSTLPLREKIEEPRDRVQ